MKNNPTLSIAIPTYNRSEELKNTLNSILNQNLQTWEDIEIIISDNCSTDDTRAIIETYQKKYPHIKYSKNDINRGIDYNIYKAVNLSKGEYVYLISDDDLMLEGSIEKMLSLIKNHQDISFFYINGIGFTLDEEKNKKFFSTPVISTDNDIIFHDKNDFVEFIQLQVTFISAFLLHRETWNKNKNKEQFIGTDIYLSYDLFHLLANSSKYMFVHEPLIGVHASYTIGNYRIFYAFAYQWRKLLLEEAPKIGFDAKRMRKVFNSNIKHLRGRIRTIKRGVIPIKIDSEMVKYIVQATYDTKVFWLNLLPALLKPRFIYKLELYFKNKIKPFREKIKKS